MQRNVFPGTARIQRRTRPVSMPGRRVGTARRRPQLINPRVARGARGHLYLRVYVFQAGLAAVSLTLAIWAADLLTGDTVARAVLVGAIASTAFILFIAPRGVPAQPRHAVGGHVMAIVAAAPIAFLAEGLPGTHFTGVSLLFELYAALGVGLAILLMALTETEHAPAAGTALAVVAHGLDWRLIVFLMTIVLLLAAIHALLKERLHDLY